MYRSRGEGHEIRESDCRGLECPRVRGKHILKEELESMLFTEDGKRRIGRFFLASAASPSRPRTGLAGSPVSNLG